MTPYAGIPTSYKGVRYRSRLEAKWAAFFHLIGWEAHYEPFDLKGWIPDFVINGRFCPVALDVKPVTGMGDPLFRETADKIGRSGWHHNAMIVSYFWPQCDTVWEEFGVGWLNEFEFDDDRLVGWDVAPFQVTDNTKIIAGFCHATGSFTDRITGHYPGGQTGSGEGRTLEVLWAAAGNEVQWAAGNPRR